LDAPKAKYNEAGKMHPGLQTTNIIMNARLQSSDNNRIEPPNQLPPGNLQVAIDAGNALKILGEGLTACIDVIKEDE
jgi:hypothetical protein